MYCGSMPLAPFLAMWTLTMAPMMLPSLVPALQRYGRAAGNVWRTLPVAAAYFLVWASAGLAIYPLQLARFAPMAAAVFVALAGLFQFTRWKATVLACCRGEHGSPSLSPWRHGLRHGLNCVGCCGNLMAVLVVIDAMDPIFMTAVTAAITFERFRGERAARAVGVLVCALALFLIIRGV
jgi:predicted metal-binding membrane protein